MDGAEARKDAEKEAAEWLKAQEAQLNRRYEKELMNPKEGLALGSISSLVMPTDLREVLGKNLGFLIRHYTPSPMTGQPSWVTRMPSNLCADRPTRR